MPTFIKTKFNNSDYQKNIDKYRVAVNITENYVISKLIFLRIIIPNPENKAIISCKNKYVKMFRMDLRTFWSQLSSCYAFHNVSNY